MSLIASGHILHATQCDDVLMPHAGCELNKKLHAEIKYNSETRFPSKPYALYFQQVWTTLVIIFCKCLGV